MNFAWLLLILVEAIPKLELITVMVFKLLFNEFQIIIVSAKLGQINCRWNFYVRKKTFIYKTQAIKIICPIPLITSWVKLWILFSIKFISLIVFILLLFWCEDRKFLIFFLFLLKVRCFMWSIWAMQSHGGWCDIFLWNLFCFCALGDIIIMYLCPGCSQAVQQWANPLSILSIFCCIN